MTDLVQKIREALDSVVSWPWQFDPQCLSEAADEIERLQGALETIAASDSTNNYGMILIAQRVLKIGPYKETP